MNVMVAGTAPAFHPVYCLRSEVDISSLALTGMKQSGLCVLRESGFEFHSTDTYSMIEDKLRVLFPKLFNWISLSEPDDTDTSSWLICMKEPYSRKSLIVYSDDQSLPTGFDIMSACQLSRSKVGFQNRVLYLGRSFILVIYFILNFLAVTRDPVPSNIAITWRPSVSSTQRSSSKSKLELDSDVLELEDTDSDSAEDQSFGVALAVDQVEDDIGVQTGKSFASESRVIKNVDINAWPL
jgi:hypothetical protein